MAGECTKCVKLLAIVKIDSIRTFTGEVLNSEDFNVQ